MGESRARTGFGQVDLQVPEEPGVEEETSEAFGELDWDLPESNPPMPAAAPVKTASTSPVHGSSRQTVRRDEAEMAAVLDAEREKTAPPPASGDRVAAMREAYARGDAEGALAIANAMEAATMPPPAGGFDHPDAGVDVEVAGEAEIEIDEQEPVHEKDLTRVAPVSSPVLMTLTERQGIPRVLKGPQEIAKLPIDHRAGFLLGFIDGMQTMEEILDVCAMPPNEALELIRALVDLGVIEIE